MRINDCPACLRTLNSNNADVIAARASAIEKAVEQASVTPSTQADLAAAAGSNQNQSATDTEASGSTTGSSGGSGSSAGGSGSSAGGSGLGGSGSSSAPSAEAEVDKVVVVRVSRCQRFKNA